MNVCAGMNLKSGHEDEDGWFFWVTIISTVFATVVTVGSLSYLNEQVSRAI
jgi:hypothetical protein